MLTLGWPGGEVEVTKKRIQIIFLPLMVLGNESPKEFRLCDFSCDFAKIVDT